MQTCEAGSVSKKRNKGRKEEDKSYSTQECRRPNKKKRATSRDKSKCSNPTAPRSILNHFKTSPRASASRGEVSTDFSPWLNKAESPKLWSPTETDLRGLESSCLNGRFAFTGQSSSWFHVNKFQPIQTRSLPMISSPFVTCSWPRTTDGEPLPWLETDARAKSLVYPRNASALKKHERALGAQLKTHKIKLIRFLRPHQEAELMRIFGANRWVYNQSVAIVNDKKHQDARKEEKISWNKYLRRAIINSDSDLLKSHSWLNDIGYGIKDDAIVSLLSSIKGCQTRLKEKTIDKFKMSFRSRKYNRSEAVLCRKGWLAVDESSRGGGTIITVKLPCASESRLTSL